MSKRSLIDSIEVKRPCSEDWKEMRGNERVRFCDHCALEVNNLSALTRKQAMRLVSQSKGRICVRYVKNPQTNAPVFAGKLYQISRRTGIAAGVLSASLSLSTLVYAQEGDEAQTNKTKPSVLRINQSGYFDPIDKDGDREIKTESETASITGSLIDPQGAVIPNFQITLTNMETGLVQTTTTSEDGAFEFKNVTAGTYTLKSEGKSGFREKEINQISVRDNENLKQNIMLDYGEIAIMGDIAVIEFRNPLHRAVSSDDLEEVKNLIARGENVNGRDENYNNITPLFLAVENGSLEMVETLLNFGAKINARDSNRQTPLMRLDEDASAELVRTLIKFGAKVNLTDNQGNTTLILAAGAAVKPEVLEVLLIEGVDVNAQNNAGRTALMEAANADNLESVRALLAAGANVHLTDEEGETALQLTTNDEIEKLLTAYGASAETDSN